jgi:hypothetical protein
MLYCLSRFAIEPITDFPDRLNVAGRCLVDQGSSDLAQGFVVFACCGDFHPERVPERLVALLSSWIGHLFLQTVEKFEAE